MVHPLECISLQLNVLLVTSKITVAGQLGLGERDINKGNKAELKDCGKIRILGYYLCSMNVRGI